MAAQDQDLRGESSRNNGWTLPLHVLQLSGWVAVVYFMLIFLTTMVPALPEHWQPAAYIISGLISLGIVVTMLTATTLNPADPAVLGKANKTVGRLDRSKHPHAIQNQHCYLCEVNVGPKSKHCRACNKCIADFDHHCKWLNNCVGGRNYKWFLSSLVAGALGTLIIFSVGLLEFVAYFVDKDNRDILYPYILLKEENRENETAQFYIFHQPVSDEGWLTITGITSVLAIISLLLLAHLLFFHIWLWFKGLTTYEYIVRLREKEGYQDAENNKQSAANSSRTTTFRERRERSSTRNANKVTPSKTTDSIDGQTKQKRRDESLEEYRQTLERSDQADGGETPPPLSSPLHHTEDQVSITTSVKKLKKKKKRESNSSQQQVATLGDSALYVHGVDKGDNPIGKNSLPPLLTKGKTKAKKGSLPKAQSGSDSEPESLQEVPVEKNSKKSKSSGRVPEPLEETIDLNATQMFTLNTSAKLLPDGSLDYSGRNAFSQLPLTPVSTRRQRQVPPLDLTPLRSSNDSVMSSLNFQPFSGTVRSTDTYRPSERPPGHQALASLPENGYDLTV